jgi:hypothetical protein
LALAANEAGGTTLAGATCIAKSLHLVAGWLASTKNFIVAKLKAAVKATFTLQ